MKSVIAIIVAEEVLDFPVITIPRCPDVQIPIGHASHAMAIELKDTYIFDQSPGFDQYTRIIGREPRQGKILIWPLIDCRVCAAGVPERPYRPDF
jgi:hypothetical protein